MSHKTPSFYTTAEEFERFLFRTSYYRALQEAVLSLVPAGAGRVLELGTGTGHTAARVAAKVAGRVTAVDFRPEVLATARRLHASAHPNLEFVQGDMMDAAHLLPTLGGPFDAVVFLYSFHHILDPLARKSEVLEAVFRHLAPGGAVIVGEAFLPRPWRPEDAREILDLWTERGREAYLSVFWEVLREDEGPDRFERAESVATHARAQEVEAGRLVAARDNEYLVSMEWLTGEMARSGFTGILARAVNRLWDGVVAGRRVNP